MREQSDDISVFVFQIRENRISGRMTFCGDTCYLVDLIDNKL
jgi:hypothetical protein